MAAWASAGIFSNGPSAAAALALGPPVAGKTFAGSVTAIPNRSSRGVAGKPALYSSLYFRYTKRACASGVADVPHTVVPCSTIESKRPVESVHSYQPLLTIDVVFVESQPRPCEMPGKGRESV